ncbi:MAG: serine/threonine-protein kinase [Pseudomonadota bacterium]
MNNNDTGLQGSTKSQQHEPVSIGGPARLKGVGETLGGRFVLEKCIGFGSMGTVYKAFDLRQLEGLSRKPYVALKVFNTAVDDDAELQFALKRAVQRLHALKHPNILAIEALHQDGALAYFTMEYVAGVSLGQVMQASGFTGLPLQKALEIVGGVAKALTYAHRNGCLHCDLKPANILLTQANDVKVMDFGLAQVLQQANKKTELSVFDTSMLRGLTRAYMSAELLEGQVPDERDDIYSLACITYELLTGLHPYDHMPATQARELRREASRPRQLDPQQWQALRSALSLDRQTRTHDLVAFFANLRGAQRPRFKNFGTSPLALLGITTIATISTVVVLQQYRGADVLVDARAAIAAIGDFGSSTNKNPVNGSVSTAVVSAGNSGTTGATASSDRAVPAIAALASGLKTPTQPLALATVTSVLASIPCSVLAASVTDNTIDVKGFVSRDYGIAQLNTTLAKIPGVENMKLDVQQIGAKDCAVMQLFGPYWLKSRGAAASIRTRSGDSRMTEGEALIVDIKTPNHDSWVHADYYGLDDGVIHLLPSLRARDHQAPPSYLATVGGAGNWVVSAPFGNELIVLLTTPAPLFANLRPEREATADYLTAVEKQLRQIESTHGSDRITVEFLQIQTRAKQ